MKKSLPLALASLFLLAVMAGCHDHKKSLSKEDLEARFNAAMGVTSFTDREAGLQSVAADAAEFGAADVVRKAVMAMTNTTERDDAAHKAALKLAKGGKRGEAKEIAQLITSTTLRDDTLKTLAQGTE